MQDPTQRFTSRVENYVKYRPHYPRQLLEVLRDECGLTPGWTVADIGSGTGISSELFLQHGNRVYAVEPNAAMREAAEALLSVFSSFISIDGTAEATTLPAACAELVVAGQAFHWFDREQARREFRRILKPAGWVALFWNERRTGGTPFMEAYEQLLRTYAPEYLQVSHRNIGEAELAAFFTPNAYHARGCENVQRLDLAGVQGRLLSSSYTPSAGHPQHEPMLAELARIFAQCEVQGQVDFIYDTTLYFGQWR